MVSITPSIKSIARKAYLAAPGAVILSKHIIQHVAADKPIWRTDANIYGGMYSWGLWTGYETAKNNAVARGISPEKASKAYLATGAGGVLGAKLLLAAQFPEQLSNFSALANSGGIWYGGLLGGTAALFAYAKYAKVSFVKLVDALTPAGLIGLGIGRIGCWSAGCCQGELMGLPTEPLEAAFGILVGLRLSKTLGHSSADGATTLKGLTAYAAFRLFVEHFRQEPTVAMNLTLSQWISLGILTTCAVVYSKVKKSISTTSPALPATPPSDKQIAIRQTLEKLRSSRGNKFFWGSNITFDGIKQLTYGFVLAFFLIGKTIDWFSNRSHRRALAGLIKSEDDKQLLRDTLVEMDFPARKQARLLKKLAKLGVSI
jgi:phosphatidylglycerol:prolipoprotein diacylglycerol transferase